MAAVKSIIKSAKSPSWSYQMKPVLTSLGAKPYSRWDFLISTLNNYITGPQHPKLERFTHMP